MGFAAFNASLKDGSRQAWNKGLTKTDARVEKNAKAISKSLVGVKKVMTPEGSKTLSDSAKARKLGGYRPHPNKGQRYNGVWFDSQWEVNVAISLDENNIEWIRPKTGFVWTDSGKRYFPDFYLPKFDVYLDPKNPYLMIKDQEKIQQAQIRNSIRVVLLSENQLTWAAIEKILSE